MTEEFTNEELEILGEDTLDEDPGTPSEDESNKGETQESEKEPEEIPESEQDLKKKESDSEQKGNEKVEDEKKGPVPYDRFSKVYGEKKDLERKLELYRTDPDEYFRQYPNEKPKDQELREEKETLQIPTFGEAGNLIVQGGEHDGLTLRQVYEKDPFAAQDIYMQHKENLLEAQRKEKESTNRLQEQSVQETNSFALERAKELFEKSDDFNLNDLTPEEAKQINQVISDVLDWMTKTGRGGGNLHDAYTLKNLSTILEDATKKGASGLINHLRKPSSSSISSKRTSSDTDTIENYASMDANQLAAIIDNMSDQEFINFKKNAPQKLRERLPGVDWS